MTKFSRTPKAYAMVDMLRKFSLLGNPMKSLRERENLLREREAARGNLFPGHWGSHIESVNLVGVLAQAAWEAAPGHEEVRDHWPWDTLLLPYLLTRHAPANQISDGNEEDASTEQTAVSDLLGDFTVHIAGTAERAYAHLAVTETTEQTLLKLSWHYASASVLTWYIKI